MVISKYNVLTVLILLVFVPYMLQEPGFLENSHAYYGLAPLLATGLLYLPIGFGVRRPNRYSEMSASLATLALLIGVALPALVIFIMFMVQSTVLGGSFNQLFYYIGILLSYLALIYQAGSFFRNKKK